MAVTVPRPARPPLLAWALAIGVVTMLIVHFGLRGTYWDYSEGVYALSAHLVLHGGDLYGRIVGAQPPGVFLVGAGLLSIHDSLEWLRLGVACLQLGAGLIAAEIVRRVTSSRLATVLTPAGILLTPWAVHEHGALLPELAALPILLGSVLSSTDRRRAPLTGVLCGLAPMIKVTFLIPGAAVLASCAAPARSARWALCTLAGALVATTLLSGGEFWREVILAQTQIGLRPLGGVVGYWAQAGWNLLGLLVPAALAIRYRAQARDPDLFRATAVLALAMLLTALSNLKLGTSLNVLVPIEAALVPLVACGTVFVLREARWARSASGRRLAGGSLAALALVLSQSASLITSSRHPEPFLRPGSRPAWAIAMTAGQFRSAVASARRCPSTAYYGGSPLVAFVSARRLGDDQPDQFITAHAAILRGVRRRIDAARPLCP